MASKRTTVAKPVDNAAVDSAVVNTVDNAAALAPRDAVVAEHIAERQAFIDRAAIARYSSGYPIARCFIEAEKLWAARVDYLRSKEGK